MGDAQDDRNDRIGAFYILGGAVCFALGGGIIKYLIAVEGMSWGSAAFLRHVFALPFFLTLALRGGWGPLATRRPVAHFVRGAFGFASFVLFVVALAQMKMGDAFALAYTTPFWSLAIAAVVFGERFGAGRVAATALGFAGVLLVVKPAGDFNVYALVALASAALTSAAMMMVKRLSATEPPDRIAFWFILAGLPLGAPLAALDWTPPGVAAAALLAALGGLTWVGQRFLSRGYAIGRFSKMAPLVFVQVALATLFGLVVFGEVPDEMALAGMTLIAAGTFLVVRPSR